MPWGDISMEKLRINFVEDVKADIGSFSAICRKYEISRKTGYKWYSRYCNGESLKDKSRKPFNSANKIPYEIERKIIETRERYPFWGAKKIKCILEKEMKKDFPSHTTFNNVFKRNKQISITDSIKHTPYIRFEKESPNEMWQLDFKGQFLMQNENYCYPLSLKDDCSRFGLLADAKENQKSENVKASLIKVFKKYGMPNSILCDNGKPWGDSKQYSFTSIEVWLMELDILLIHCRMKHPQTQGKVERFNRTLKEEITTRIAFKDIVHAQACLDEWLYQYNYIRPHESLNMEVPANTYQKSDRKYSLNISQFKYANEYEIVKVSKNGYLRIGKKPHFFSEAFINKNVGLIKGIENTNQINIHYRNFSIATYDIKSNKLTRNRIQRIR